VSSAEALTAAIATADPQRSIRDQDDASDDRIPSTRKPSTTRVLRRAWTADRLTGSLP